MKRITKKDIDKNFSKTVSKVKGILKTASKQKEKVKKNKLLSEFEKKATYSEIDAEAKEKASNILAPFNRQRKKMKSMDYRNFNYISLHVTTNSYQETYRAKRGYSTKDLDYVVPDILDKSDVTGVLVIFRVESEETGQKQYVSNYITKDLYELSIKGNYESIYDYVSERLQAGNTKDYNLKFIYLKVIHANT